MKLLDKILKRLREICFTINLLECEWAVKGTNWLDYWLTTRGLNPWKKRIDAIEMDYSGILDSDIQDGFECYLNLPESENPENNPLSYAYIREKQQADVKLVGYVTRFPNNYIYKCLDNDVEDNIFYVKDHEDPTTQWKLLYPSLFLKKQSIGFIKLWAIDRHV